MGVGLRYDVGNITNESSINEGNVKNGSNQSNTTDPLSHHITRKRVKREEKTFPAVT